MARYALPNIMCFYFLTSSTRFNPYYEHHAIRVLLFGTRSLWALRIISVRNCLVEITEQSQDNGTTLRSVLLISWF